MNNTHAAAASGSAHEAVRAIHAVADVPTSDILDEANGDAGLSYILIDADGDGKVDHLMFTTGDGNFGLEILDEEYEARAS